MDDDCDEDGETLFEKLKNCAGGSDESGVDKR